jgi:hypothetical protein
MPFTTIRSSLSVSVLGVLALALTPSIANASPRSVESQKAKAPYMTRSYGGTMVLADLGGLSPLQWEAASIAVVIKKL